jgi:hypothetical protein
VALQWLAVDLLTGTIICELPGIISTEPYKRTLGQYETQSVKLAVVPGVTDDEWVRGTLPGAAALIAVRGDSGQEVIHWGGIVLRRTRTVQSNLVTLGLATVECYLDRRFTGAYTATNRAQNLVVADLIAQFVAANQGLPITVVDVTPAGQVIPTISPTFYDYDDKTVYSDIGSLSTVVGGPEWTGHWTWNRGPNTITPIIYTGNRIGQPMTGVGPGVTFDSANLLNGTLVEEFGAQSGANDVAAVFGQGLGRLIAPSVAADFGGRPRHQFRFSPFTALQDASLLQTQADHALGILDNGGNTVTLQASATSGPQLGSDWNLGDDVGYELTGAAFPEPVEGVARAIGYETDDAYTSPVLYIPGVI